MLMSKADLADKYTILLLKKEHGVEVSNALLSTMKEELDGINLQTLLSINHMMWVMEDLISDLADESLIGKAYLFLRELTVKRMEAKNVIAKQFDQPTEQKTY